MGSMHTGLEDGRKHFPRWLAYFAERARGGVRADGHRRFAPTSRVGPSRSPGHCRRRPRHGGTVLVTDAVHAERRRIALQILHTGRYGTSRFWRGRLRIKSPIFAIRAAPSVGPRQSNRQIRAFVRCA